MSKAKKSPTMQAIDDMRVEGADVSMSGFGAVDGSDEGFSMYVNGIHERVSFAYSTDVEAYIREKGAQVVSIERDVPVNTGVTYWRKYSHGTNPPTRCDDRLGQRVVIRRKDGRRATVDFDCAGNHPTRGVGCYNREAGGWPTLTDALCYEHYKGNGRAPA